MASRIEYAVSCTPICAVAAGENLATETVAADVAKSLSGAGSVTCTWGTTVGYASGAPVYVSTGGTTGTGTTVGTLTSIKFLSIKHTGYAYSSTSALGAATTDKVIVCCNSATVAAGITVAVLGAGDQIILPFQTATTAVFYVAPSGTTAIAVEVMATP